MINWHKIEIPETSKLFYTHRLMYLHAGHNYSIEIQEYPDAQFIGFMESSMDENRKFSPSQAETLESCLQQLINYLVD